MTPIVKAECYIAVLLDFKDNYTAAQGVNRSSRNEYAVAWLGDDAHEVVRDGPVGKRMPQIAVSRTRFQARINAASFICLNHDPRFGLPGFPRWNQLWVRIAGMHLHGEHLVCVQKLEKQRETAEARRQLAHQLFLESLHHLSKGLPCQRSIRNHALVVRTVAEHPCFTDGSVPRKRCGEQIGQPPAAPQPILVDRLEAQGIQRHLIHALSTNSQLQGGVRMHPVNSVPLPGSIRRGAQPGCSVRGEPKPAAPLVHWPPGPSKAPGPA